MTIKLIICLFGLLLVSTAITCPEGCETCEMSQYSNTTVFNHYTINCTQCSPGYEFDILEDIYDAVEGYQISTTCIKKADSIPNCLVPGAYDPNYHCKTGYYFYWVTDVGSCAKILNNTETPGVCPRECIT